MYSKLEPPLMYDITLENQMMYETKTPPNGEAAALLYLASKGLPLTAKKPLKVVGRDPEITLVLVNALAERSSPK